MLVYGAGGHAKVIISCLEAGEVSIESIFDDDPSKIKISGYPLAGPYDPTLFKDAPIIIAIGDNQVRSLIAKKIGHRFGVVAHPSCIIDKTAKIGAGSVIMHSGIVQAGSAIGNHVIINTRASIDHDCNIGDFAHIAPGAILCGNVRVGAFTLIGTGAILVPNISIGDHCTIAAGSVVTKNIPSHSIVRGNPAKIIKTQIGSTH